MQAIFGVFKRLSKPSKLRPTLLTKPPYPGKNGPASSVKPDTPKTVPLQDSFQRPLRPPAGPPTARTTPSAGEPSLNAELNAKIKALFGPSRRVPLKPAQP
ncbi:hypothetical protein [Vampirovibrio chlorellavorus]|uniref:hypothetical protein n=1 Tax=Vampirovibrio chlorellavorus TaxID=758823 RepID=UPI0026EA8143|nr:hypothetical protein [Vampirovibrio chlorellavorus]